MGCWGPRCATHVGLLVPGTRGMSSRQCKVRPEISKISGACCDPQSRQAVTSFEVPCQGCSKADHICGGFECMAVEVRVKRCQPGPKVQGNAGGPNQHAYALLECLARHTSASQQGFDQGVQLGQFRGHELNGVVREVDLPTAPNQAILELHLFPRNGCCNGTKEEHRQGKHVWCAIPDECTEQVVHKEKGFVRLPG